VVTAGAMSGVANSGVLDGLTANADQSAQLTTLERVQNAAVNSLSKAIVNTAADVVISGKDLDEALRTQLLTAAAGVIGEVGANQIGDAAATGDINTAAQYIAHAALGCGVGAVGGGNCASGAVGGVVGELSAEIYTILNADELSSARMVQAVDEWKQKGIDIAKLTTAITAFALGEDVTVAADAAGNAAENNTMRHISRAVQIAFIEHLAEHRATVVERDSADDFPASIIAELGEPVQFSNGKYGYVLEHLNVDGKLLPSVNREATEMEKSKNKYQTVDLYNTNKYTEYWTLDDEVMENALLKSYASAISLNKRDTSTILTYPGMVETTLCYMNRCLPGFTNSNTMADKMLENIGIKTPDTGNASVPGGKYDSDDNADPDED
jgi:hypothetical protein